MAVEALGVTKPSMFFLFLSFIFFSVYLTILAFYQSVVYVSVTVEASERNSPYSFYNRYTPLLVGFVCTRGYKELIAKAFMGYMGAFGLLILVFSQIMFL